MAAFFVFAFWGTCESVGVLSIVIEIKHEADQI